MKQQSALPKLLILSSAENDENVATNDDFVKRLNQGLQGKCDLEWKNYNNIGLEIRPGSLRAFVVSDGRSLDSFRAVYFKSYFRYHEQATSIAEALSFMRVPFIGSELGHYIPAYKLTQLARLSKGKFQIPKTLYLPLSHYVLMYEEVCAKLGEVFIFKAIDGSTGDDNFLVKNLEQLKEIVSQNQGRHFIAQAFIPNKSDLRFLIVGGELKLVIERKRKDDSTHLNNTSQGGVASLISLQKLNPQLKNMALQAAHIMNRDVAGVDIMLEEGTGVPYVLEVNASPQIASGAFADEKLAVYIEFFKKLSTASSEKLAYIGQAEHIDLPEFGLESVPARIDTGARTSAIWASHISEKNGELSFILFNKGSKFYDGQTIHAKDFGRRLVTNSTGNVENRYTVKLKVGLEGRKFNMTFTLADRSAQSYPVLLGRNILRGKFVVDVKLGKPLVKKGKLQEQS